jgi:hypothetical protein
VTADWLRRKEREGLAQNVSAVLDENTNGVPSTDNIGSEVTLAQQDDLSRDPEHSSDPARKEYLLYECYVQMDTDGDGFLENRMIWIVSDKIVRNEINPYKYPPFVKLCGIDDIDKFSRHHGSRDGGGHTEVADVPSAPNGGQHGAEQQFPQGVRPDAGEPGRYPRHRVGVPIRVVPAPTSARR